MRRYVFGGLLWLLGGASAHAFLGVGDITFDPPVHAELISLFDQVVGLYHGVLSEVRRMQAVEATLQTEQQDIRVVASRGLARYAALPVPRGVPASMGRWLEAARSTGRRWSDLDGYYHQQARRIERLRRLDWLARGVRHDARRSALDLGARSSRDITARSTVTLAALAAQNARAAARRHIRQAAERHNARRLPAESAHLYRAFAGTP